MPDNGIFAEYTCCDRSGIFDRIGSGTKDADIILVLKDGRLMESGNHASLMELNGEYALLYRAQAEGYDLSGVL